MKSVMLREHCVWAETFEPSCKSLCWVTKDLALSWDKFELLFSAPTENCYAFCDKLY